MDPSTRLRRSADVRAAFSDGAVFHGHAMVVHARPRVTSGAARWTVVAGRKIGGAVARNRAKRRLRALVRGVDLPAGVDLVVVAKPAVTGAVFEELRSELGRLLGLVERHAGASA